MRIAAPKLRYALVAAVALGGLFYSWRLPVQTVHAMGTAMVQVPVSDTDSSDGCMANNLGGEDDYPSAYATLPFTMNFLGSTYSSAYVNNNGNLTFADSLSTYTPFGLVGAATPIIAPFFADVDTRYAGNTVHYGSGVYGGHAAFCATWPGVDYFYSSSSHDKLNYFQVLLVDRSDTGSGNFDIYFNYDQIQWETGNASGGSNGLGGYSARAGYSNGDSNDPYGSYELGGSGIPGSFLDSNTTDGLIYNSNVGVPGRYVFPVRNGGVLSTTASYAQPTSNGWYNSSVPMSFNATDVGGPGVQALHVNVNGTDTATSATATTETTTTTTVLTDTGGTATTVTVTGTTTTYPSSLSTSATVTAEGLNTVAYYAVDGNNVTEDAHTVTIPIDETPPTVSATATLSNGSAYSSGDVTSQNVTVTLSATDPAPSSGTTITAAGIKKGSSKTGTSSVPGGSGTSISRPTNPVTVRSPKSGGASSRPTLPLPPNRVNSGSSSSNPGTSKPNVPGVPGTPGKPGSSPQPGTPSSGGNTGISSSAIHANASVAPLNPESGVASITYWVDEGSPVTTNASSVVVPAFTSSGQHTIHYYATDLAGNSGSGSPGSFVVHISSQPPTTAASAKNADNTTYDLTTSPWTKQSVTVTLTPTDYSGTGIAATHYAIDCAAPCTTYQTYSTPFTISTTGAHTVTFYSVDNASNSETAQTVNINIDKAAPTTSATAKNADNTTYDLTSSPWTGQSVTVTLNPSDTGGSGLASTSYAVDCASPPTCTYSTYSSPIAISTSGTHTVTFYSTDNAGNQETAHTVTVKIDKTAPTTTASATLGTGTTAYDLTSSPWTNQSVKITLTPSDASGSGIASTSYALNCANPSTCTYSTYSAPFTISTAGTTTVTFFSTDNVGNKETAHSVTVKIDTAAPTTTAAATLGTGTTAYNLSTSPWTNQSVKVTLNPSDTGGSGLASTSYAVDCASPPTCTYSTYSAPFTISTDGAHTVTFFSSDNAGNQETAHTVTVRIDTTPPVTTATAKNADNSSYNLTSSTAWTHQSVSITLTPSDTAGSGVASTSYAVDCASPPTCTYSTYSTPVTISTAGTHTFTFFSTDNAGNKETAHTVTIRIDTTAPVTHDNADSSWHNSAVTVTLTPSDTGGSGVAATYYKIDSASSYTQGTSVLISAPADHSNDGIHTITYSSTDNAGNTETAHSTTVKIDTTGPAISVSGVTNGRGALAPAVPTISFSDPPPSTLSSSTSTSGVKTSSSTLDGSPYTSGSPISTLGPHTLAIQATDAAGNVSTQTIAFTVFAYPSTGRFVLGDGTVTSALAAATPQSVTFYSPNWYQLNLLVNPPQAKYAPTTFKGMAASTSSSPPACGGTWTGTGSYTTAAPASVPTYMGVLVSSQITLAGSKLTGNITRIVVVKTSAYSANQGRTGTGTIVATVCGP